MSFDNQNPYAAPATSGADLDYPQGKDVLARRLTRLAAAFVDGLVIMVFTVPFQIFTGSMAAAFEGRQPTVIQSLVGAVFGLVVWIAINGYLLFSRGQTIGKYAFKIQIVDYKTTMLLPVSRVYIIRYLWYLPFLILVTLIPGSIDDAAVGWVQIINVLFIFGASRRCLHDYMAGSVVVEYRPDRKHLGG